MFIALAVAVYIFHTRTQITAWLVTAHEHVVLWMSVYQVRRDGEKKTDSDWLFALGISLDKLRNSVIRATLLLLLVFLPTFCVLSSLYPTLTVQYAWYVSAAYLKGRAPAVVIAVINSIVMIGLNIGYVYITLTYGTELIIFAQVCVALFKLVWNDVAVRWMVQIAP
eukprot:gene31485-38886_t